MLLADEISHSFNLYSSVASCLSGVELDRGKIILLGNAPGVGGRFRIVFCVMQDALDIDGIYNGIRNAGLDLPERPRSADLGDRLVNCFIKCETDCAADSRSCWTIPMSTITATPRASWPESRLRPWATRPSSSRSTRCVRGRRAARWWPIVDVWICPLRLLSAAPPPHDRRSPALADPVDPPAARGSGRFGKTRSACTTKIRATTIGGGNEGSRTSGAMEARAWPSFL